MENYGADTDLSQLSGKCLLCMVLSQTSSVMQRDGRNYGGLRDGFIVFLISPMEVVLTGKLKILILSSL